MYPTNANLNSNVTISDKLINGQHRLAPVLSEPHKTLTVADREATDAERVLRVLWMQRFRL